MASVQRMYSGVDSVLAADVVRRDQSNREKWPYMHVYPPVNAEPVHLIGNVLVPAQGSTVVTLAYMVPPGFRFYLRGLIQTYVGAAFIPGDALWTIDRNTPVGVPNFQAQLEQGLVNIPVPVGSFSPFTTDQFARCYEFEPLDLVQSKAKNIHLNPAVLPSDGVFLTGFFGYIVPDVGKR